MSEIAGRVLNNRYQVERLLGRGGMADVYQAFDMQRQTYVAIKLIREDLADDTDFIRRFGREAAALARLDHPNIVRYYAMEQDGVLSFIVMDYVSGSTLQRRLTQAGGPMPLNEVTAILHQVGPALHYAHTMGFIHRDIKPGNIMLREDGTALLSDFGAARAMEGSTLTTISLGTPAYMSPEQILGRDLQPSTDLYSFGLVLYEMVAGRRPFTGDESGLTGTGTLTRLREAHLRLNPPNPRELNPAIPPALADVILKTLAKEVADRWPDVLSLVDAWDTALGTPDGRSRRPKAGALPLAESPGSIPTMVAPAVIRTGAPEPSSSRPASPSGSPSQQPSVAPAVAAVPVSAPLPAPAEQAGRGSRAPWLIIGTVAALLIVAVAVWQLVIPALASSRTASLEADISATVVAQEASSRDATATTEAAAQLASAEQAQETATAAAETAAAAEQAAAAAEAATAAAEATQQVLDAGAAATAEARTAEQALAMAQATETAVAEATGQAASAAATAAAVSSSTPEATATTAPTATPAASVATNTPAPASPPKAPGVVLDFESAVTWRRGNQPYGELSQAADPVYAGGYSAQLSYDFPAIPDNYVVFQARPPIAIAGQPAALSVWVYGDGSGHFLNAWLEDSYGQVRQYTFGQIKHEGWQQLTAPLDAAAGWPNVHISGPDSGKLSFPARLQAIVLDGVPDGVASKGTTYLDDLTTGLPPVAAQ